MKSFSAISVHRGGELSNQFLVKDYLKVVDFIEEMDDLY